MHDEHADLIRSTLKEKAAPRRFRRAATSRLRRRGLGTGVRVADQLVQTIAYVCVSVEITIHDILQALRCLYFNVDIIRYSSVCAAPRRLPPTARTQTWGTSRRS